MAERSADWLRQPEANLRHARNSRDAGDHDWSAFAAHQAAEKALKALFQKLHLEADPPPERLRAGRAHRLLHARRGRAGHRRRRGHP